MCDKCSVDLYQPEKGFDQDCGGVMSCSMDLCGNWTGASLEDAVQCPGCGSWWTAPDMKKCPCGTFLPDGGV